MKKKSEPKLCGWCGTNLRGRTTCPRGSACAAEQANHDELVARIAATKERR